ncbi:hypothetical protein L873DRAFT_1799517, partial [Choiromyces venosus 120613-1]
DFHDGTTAYSKTVRSHTEKNILGYFGRGHKQISKKTGVPVPTVQGIVKRYHTCGQIEDATSIRKTHVTQSR